MCRTSFTALLALSYLAAGACGGEETYSAEAASQLSESVVSDTGWAVPEVPFSRPEAVTVSLRNADGERTNLTLAPGVHVAAMATWCPHSEAFAKALTDPELVPYLANRRLVFVFETDEWDAVERQGQSLVESGELTATQLAERIRAGLFDREKLSLLNGEIYYHDDETALDVDGTPNFYSGHDRIFDKGWVRWLVEDIGVPVTLANRLLDEYDPPADG
jgi:hypothetical protein